MQKMVDYFNGVRDEMTKVSWPAKDEVVSATSLVIVFALITSLIVWGFDQIVSRIIGFIL